MNPTFHQTAYKISQDFAAMLNSKFGNIADGAPAPRNRRGSQLFVTRVKNDGSMNTDMIIMDIKAALATLNKSTKSVRREGRLTGRFRLIKRGRKPVNGGKYGYGGSLPVSKSAVLDLYVTYETTWVF